MNSFVLELSNNEYFKFELYKPVEQLVRFSDARVVFHVNTQEYFVAQDCAYDLLEPLIAVLQRALHNQAQLHASITEDIGYMWNKVLHDEAGLEYDGHFWVGQRYLMWATPGCSNPLLATWVYNDKQGSIILEITPDYLWHFSDPQPNDAYSTYEEFMRSYKPVYKTEISHDIARRWLGQAEFLFAQIQEKIERGEYYD